MTTFDESYYRSANYTNYLDRQEKYTRTAKEITELLSNISVLKKHSRILDYGCAVGFLSRALKDLNYKVDSYDISEWATGEARRRGCDIIDTVGGSYNLGIFLDVLEHMTEQQIDDVFASAQFEYLLVRIPVSEDRDPDRYYLEVSRKDPTHINCATADVWERRMAVRGFTRSWRLNLHTIYDSPGCFCALLGS